MFRKQGSLFQNPIIHYPIHDLDLSFIDYINQSKSIISQYRLDLNHHPDLTIRANCPFEFDAHKPRYGALLIHGLFDSPFVMRDIGQRLSSEGLLVRSILLPGHGTIPGALQNITCEEWIQSVRYGISSFQKTVDGLFLIGFSTGGALACHLATQSSIVPIQGLMLLAPAFKIHSRFAFLAEWINVMGNYWQRAKWLTCQPEVDYTKYCSIPFNAVYQLERLIKKIKNQPRLTCPQWMALSLNDETVCNQTSLRYFKQQSHSNNRIISFNATHTGLPIAPSNPHYGKEGDCALKERLEFNPDFDFLMQEMITFIDSVSFEEKAHQTTP